jgi:hypothetical protein
LETTTATKTLLALVVVVAVFVVAIVIIAADTCFRSNRSSGRCPYKRLSRKRWRHWQPNFLSTVNSVESVIWKAKNMNDQRQC